MMDPNSQTNSGLVNPGVTLKSNAKSKYSESAQRSAFAKALVERRKAQGYQTAYAFFHKNGGEDHFGFSYHHYLLIEKGKRLPRQEGLKQIMSCFSTGPSATQEIRRNLLELYLRALTDGDPIFDMILGSR